MIILLEKKYNLIAYWIIHTYEKSYQCSRIVKALIENSQKLHQHKHYDYVQVILIKTYVSKPKKMHIGKCI